MDPDDAPMELARKTHLPPEVAKKRLCDAGVPCARLASVTSQTTVADLSLKMYPHITVGVLQNALDAEGQNTDGNKGQLLRRWLASADGAFPEE